MLYESSGLHQSPQQISQPPQAAPCPLSMLGCLRVLLVGLIPLAGPIILCVWSFGPKNAKRALARAVLIVRIGLSLLAATIIVQGAVYLTRWSWTFQDALPDPDMWESQEEPDLPDDWEYYFQPWGDPSQDGASLTPCKQAAFCAYHCN